jgi:hypothetical protein
MTIESIFRFLHSWNRWLLLIVSVVALLYFARGWLLALDWTKRGQTLLTLFSSLIGLQWILGLVFLIALGSATGFGVRHYWEHLTIQTIALAVAHVHMAWRKKVLADRSRYRRSLLLILAVLVLVIVGILLLPATIQWRFMGLGA